MITKYGVCQFKIQVTKHKGRCLFSILRIFVSCWNLICLSCLVSFQVLTSDTKYSTISGWSNMAAQCNGVIFCTSHDARHCIFSAGCMLNISFTISIAPCAHARWTGVERSCCWVEILAPDFRHSSTAYAQTKNSSVSWDSHIYVLNAQWITYLT